MYQTLERGNRGNSGCELVYRKALRSSRERRSTRRRGRSVDAGTGRARAHDRIWHQSARRICSWSCLRANRVAKFRYRGLRARKRRGSTTASAERDRWEHHSYVAFVRGSRHRRRASRPCRSRTAALRDRFGGRLDRHRRRSVACLREAEPLRRKPRQRRA